jgi:hypothetical protein
MRRWSIATSPRAGREGERAHDQEGAGHAEGGLGFAKRAGMVERRRQGAIFPKFSADYEPRDRSLDTWTRSTRCSEVLPSRDVAAQMAFAIATSAEAACCPGRSVRRVGRLPVRAAPRKKREHRWRTVPIVTALAAADARLHAQARGGEGDPLMFRCTEWGLRNGLFDRLQEARHRPRQPERSAPHLRRPHAGGGFPLELIAPLMGHKDTRMLERVYGRLSPEQLRDRLILALNASAACDRVHANSPCPKRSRAVTEGHLTHDGQRVKVAPRAGFEPATHGLTVRALFGSYHSTTGCVIRASVNGV